MRGPSALFDKIGIRRQALETDPYGTFLLNGYDYGTARNVWNLPKDAFAFRGAGGQDTYVVPSLELVVVRMGHFPGARVGGQDLSRALALLSEAVPEAVLRPR